MEHPERSGPVTLTGRIIYGTVHIDLVRLRRVEASHRHRFRSQDFDFKAISTHTRTHTHTGKSDRGHLTGKRTQSWRPGTCWAYRATHTIAQNWYHNSLFCFRFNKPPLVGGPPWSHRLHAMLCAGNNQLHASRCPFWAVVMVGDAAAVVTTSFS